MKYSWQSFYLLRPQCTQWQPLEGKAHAGIIFSPFNICPLSRHSSSTNRNCKPLLSSQAERGVGGAEGGVTKKSNQKNNRENLRLHHKANKCETIWILWKCVDVKIQSQNKYSHNIPNEEKNSHVFLLLSAGMDD